MTSRSLLAFSILFALAGCSRNPVWTMHLPEACRQVILVVSDGWDQPKGTLRRWEKGDEGRWKSHGVEVPVSLGRTGLARGHGVHGAIEGDFPDKIEGDGKAPAGIFRLGTAFGYGGEAPEGCRYPWRQATANDFFVDDIRSPDYNRWVHLEGGPEMAAERWQSFERMRREDELYRYGITVEHNTDPVVPGAGSAIFLHVWKGSGQPTSGCTAMAEVDLIDLLTWLRPEAEPLLIQIPSDQLSHLRHDP